MTKHLPRTTPGRPDPIIHSSLPDPVTIRRDRGRARAA
jgi:hypothetical protein